MAVASRQMPKRVRTVSWITLLSLLAVGASACRDTPTGVARLDGVFPLMTWNGQSLPFDLGSFPLSSPGSPPNVPPCDVRIPSGSLTLNAAAGTFSYSYDMVDCEQRVVGGSQVTGSYSQAGSSIEFQVETYGQRTALRFTGEVEVDRIVVSDWDPTLVFRR